MIGAGALVLAAALLGYWLVRPGPDARAAEQPGHFVVAMHDYYFSPGRMTWHVGEKITLTLVNRSALETAGGMKHEFMAGRGPRRGPTMLGPNQEDGFHQDFFTGLRVWYGDAQGVDVLMKGKATLTGSEAAKDVMRSPTGMPMAGHGLMVDLTPGGTATIRFTVPDRPGTWTYGCFDGSGEHFLNGMRGTVTILR